VEELDLIAALRQLGYRITPQRALVLEVLQTSAEHVTAEQIYEQVRAREPYVNVATVYRTLDLLDELGLVCRADLGDGQATYASASHGPHLHLVCRRCGRVVEADHRLAEPLETGLLERYGFEADLHHFAISGFCAECRDISLG
jgi:Fur family ferric uptake transcriptional regulator